jgi:hypothetical protein
MNVREYRNNPRLAQSALTAAVLGMFLLFMGFAAPQMAHADARSRCQHRIEHARAKLDHEVQRHGEHSPQADAAWHELRAERERCWNENHEWWNDRDHTWHKDNDWDHDPRIVIHVGGPGH